VFSFLPSETAAEHSVICIASDEASLLGTLSSALHANWALAAGGRLGMGNDARYQKALCFDPFPFPDPPQHLRDRIGLVAETLDHHRKDAIARDERVTMTGMYNVVEKLRSGAPLTDAERGVHESAACGVLRDLHDELDRLVAEAYGWPWPMEREEILERLVALHDERVAEERAGQVRWLRPEYQVPRFGGAAAQGGRAAEAAAEAAAEPEVPALSAWPAEPQDQIMALRASVARAAGTPAEVAARFDAALADAVQRYLELLAVLGHLRADEDGRYHATLDG
jgi:hypothetical protein